MTDTLDATTTTAASADAAREGGATATVRDAASDAASDAPFACPADVTKLFSLLRMSACGVCTIDKCQSFAADCTADCACTDALLTLLTCVTIGDNVQSCQQTALGALTPAQLDEFIECNGTCDVACSSTTFFPDAGDDASDESFDASDRADAADASDASDADAGH